MNTNITLQGAVKAIYGQTYTRKVDISSTFCLFTPYQNIITKQTQYFRIIQMPIDYHASEASYTKASQFYYGFLHETQIIFLQRNFQLAYYLLKSSHNIISLRGILQIRADCGQFLQIHLVYKLIEFVAMIQGKKYYQLYKMDINQIGIQQLNNFKNSDYSFKICDYSLYFLKNQSKSQLSSQLLFNSCKKLITRIVTLNKHFNMTKQQIYQATLDTYDLPFANFINELLSLKNFHKNAVLELLSHISEHSQPTQTISDSFVQVVDDLNFDIQVEYGSITGKTNHVKSQRYGLKSPLLSSNNSSKVSRFSKNSFIKEISNFTLKRKYLYVLIFFIIIAVITGVILTLKFMNNDINCPVGQFKSQHNRCQSCSYGCSICIGNKNLQCKSCKGQMMIVKKTIQDQTGVCSMAQCKGSKISPTTCIDDKNKY